MSTPLDSTIESMHGETITMPDGAQYLLTWKAEGSPLTARVAVSTVEVRGDGTTVLSPLDVWHGVADARVGVEFHHRRVTVDRPYRTYRITVTNSAGQQATMTMEGQDATDALASLRTAHGVGVHPQSLGWTVVTAQSDSDRATLTLRHDNGAFLTYLVAPAEVSA